MYSNSFWHQFLYLVYLEYLLQKVNLLIYHRWDLDFNVTLIFVYFLNNSVTKRIKDALSVRFISVVWKIFHSIVKINVQVGIGYIKLARGGGRGGGGEDTRGVLSQICTLKKREVRNIPWILSSFLRIIGWTFEQKSEYKNDEKPL